VVSSLSAVAAIARHRHLTHRSRRQFSPIEPFTTTEERREAARLCAQKILAALVNSLEITALSKDELIQKVRDYYEVFGPGLMEWRKHSTTPAALRKRSWRPRRGSRSRWRAWSQTTMRRESAKSGLRISRRAKATLGRASGPPFHKPQ
jgi:hypothetical protein